MLKAALNKLGRWFTKQRSLGVRGEKAACRYLRRQGYHCLSRNYAIASGEVDLVMQDGEAMVFVEVKTRRQEDFIDSEFLVNPAKQRRVASAARDFLTKFHGHGRPCRFDVVLVLWPSRGEPEFRHYRHAFRART